MLLLYDELIVGNVTSTLAILGMAYAVGITLHSSATSVTSTAIGAVLLYVMCMLLESSIHPFDVLESEPEIVSGWYVDYGGVVFMVLYLGEGVCTNTISGHTPILH